MPDRSFLIYRPDGTTHIVQIALPLARIGRGDDNEIVLPDPSRSVSRLHAQVALDPSGQTVLADLKSANGTFVNDQIVQEPVVLDPDDVIRIGSYRLIFRSSMPAAAKPRPAAPPPSFQIETAEVDLGELQDRPNLLTHEGTVAVTPEMLALELLHEVGVRLARTVTA